MNDITLVIGVLRERYVSWQHVDCMDRMRMHLARSGVRNMLVGQQCTNIYKGREKVTDQFLETDGTHLLFIDSDETFAPETAMRLLQDDLPVVSGVVYQRNPPPAPCIYKQIKDSVYHFPMAQELQNWFRDNEIPQFREPCVLNLPDEMSIWEVDEVGTGCLLIKREVLEDIGEPRFDIMPGHFWGMTTDILFCRRAKEAGYKIHADLRVQLGHLTDYAVTARDFRHVDNWVEKNEPKWVGKNRSGE